MFGVAKALIMALCVLLLAIGHQIFVGLVIHHKGNRFRALWIFCGSGATPEQIVMQLVVLGILVFVAVMVGGAFIRVEHLTYVNSFSLFFLCIDLS